jgi:hypothetical protein
MDLASRSLWLQVWEELLELTAESCFLAAVLVSLPTVLPSSSSD